MTLPEEDLLWPAALPEEAGTTATRTRERDRLETVLERDLPAGTSLSRRALIADALDEAHTIAEADPDAIAGLVPEIVSTVESMATQADTAGQQVLAGNYTIRAQQHGVETLATLAPDHLPLDTEKKRETLIQAIATVLTSSNAIAVVRPAFDLLGTVVVASEDVTGPMLAEAGVFSGVRRWLPDLEWSDVRIDAVRVLGALSVTANSVQLSESAKATLRQIATADDLLPVAWSTLVMERLDISADGVPIHTSADEPPHRTVRLLCRLVELETREEATDESLDTSTLDRLLDTAGHLDANHEQYAPAFESIRASTGESPTALQLETIIQALGEFAIAGCFPGKEVSQRICDILTDLLAHSDTPPVLTEAARTLERLATAGDLAGETDCRAAFSALARAMSAPNQTDPEPLAKALVELVATGSVETVTLSGLQDGAELCGPVLGSSTDIQTAIRPFRHPAVPDHIPDLVVDAFRSSLGSITGPVNEPPAVVLAVMRQRDLLSAESTYATSCRRYCEAAVSSDELGLRTQAHIYALAHSGLLKQADLSESVGILIEGIEPVSDTSSTISAELLKTLSEAGCLDTHYDYQSVIDVLCRAAHPTTEPDPKYPVKTLTALAATNSLPVDAEYTQVVGLIEDVLGRGVDTSDFSRLVNSDSSDNVLSAAATDDSRPSIGQIARLLAAFLENGYLSETPNLEHVASLFAAHIPAPDSADVLEQGAAFGLGIVAAERPLTDVTFTESVRHLIAWTDPDLAGDGEIAALTVATLAREGCIDASLQLTDLGPLRRMATTANAAIDSRQPLVCLGTLLQTHPTISRSERDRSMTTLLRSAGPGADTHTFAATLALSWAVDADTVSNPGLSALIEDLCTSVTSLSNRPASADVEDYLALSGISTDTHAYDLDEAKAGAALNLLAEHIDPDWFLPAISDAMMSIPATSGSRLTADSTLERLLHALHTSVALSDSNFDPATVEEGAAELASVLADYLADAEGTTATQIQALELICYWSS